MKIKDEIIQFIEEAKRTPVPVRIKSNLYKDLGFDSLAFIEFLVRIEETYNIIFDINEMESCLQVNQLIALVRNKLKEQNSYD